MKRTLFKAISYYKPPNNKTTGLAYDEKWFYIKSNKNGEIMVLKL